MEVFENIAKRRRRFEWYLPVTLALGVSAIYSYIRHGDILTTQVIFYLWFGSIVIGQTFVWSIYGLGTKKTKYKPKPNYRDAGIYILAMVVIIELINVL
jgi:hypothetical protein